MQIFSSYGKLIGCLIHLQLMLMSKAIYGRPARRTTLISQCKSRWLICHAGPSNFFNGTRLSDPSCPIKKCLAEAPLEESSKLLWYCDNIQFLISCGGHQKKHETIRLLVSDTFVELAFAPQTTLINTWTAPRQHTGATAPHPRPISSHMSRKTEWNGH